MYVVLSIATRVCSSNIAEDAFYTVMVMYYLHMYLLQLLDSVTIL